MSSDKNSPFDYAAWLIDLDGTLYHHNPVRAMMAIELALCGWPAIRTLRTFRQEHERLRSAESSGDPFAAQIRRAAERLDSAESDVAKTVTTWMIDRPGKWLRAFRRRRLLQMVSRYREQGGHTALVSDYPARRKLAALGASDLFNVVVACGEPDGPEGLKPHPAGYLLAARQLAVPPHECLVIGDRQDADGEAARRAGMAFQHVGSLRIGKSNLN
jgi:FMN phosphatase YigB (HAD superfamily)